MRESLVIHQISKVPGGRRVDRAQSRLFVCMPLTDISPGEPVGLQRPESSTDSLARFGLPVGDVWPFS